MRDAEVSFYKIMDLPFKKAEHEIIQSRNYVANQFFCYWQVTITLLSAQAARRHCQAHGLKADSAQLRLQARNPVWRVANLPEV